MTFIAQLIDGTFGTATGVRCRSCGNPIKRNDEFGVCERACKRCRGR